MRDGAYEAVVIVTRKPEPPAPPLYECCICQREVCPDRWAAMSGDIDTRPICPRCVDWWSGRCGRLWGATYGDQVMVARLKAVTTCLEWETKNVAR